MNKVFSEKYIVILILLSLLISYFVGQYFENGENLPQVLKRFPENVKISPLNSGLFTISSRGKIFGYAVISQGNGYGGPLRTLIVCDTTGILTKVDVISEKETNAFFQKVEDKKYTQKFTGEKYGKFLEIGNNIESITGATLTSRGIVAAVNNGGRIIASEIFKEKLAPLPGNPFVFGLKEVFVLLLFAYWLFVNKYVNRFKTQIRLGFLIFSIMTLGFMYVTLLSLVNINSYILGYWPDINIYFYSYLLIAGTFIPVLWKKKNIYCGGVCPFGSAQDCLGMIGGAKVRIPLKLHKTLKIIPSILCHILVLLALLTRDPGYYTYEIFGTLFNITGTFVQFILLALVVIFSLFIIRPWCNYLCPVKPAIEFVKKIRILIYK